GQRMAGAELLALGDGLALAVDGGLDPVVIRVGDDQRPLGVDRLGSGKRPQKHGAARYRMEDLGDPGVHPNALSGGEHHHRDAPARLRRCWPFGPRGSVSAHGEVAAYFSLGLVGDLPGLGETLSKSVLVIQIDAELRRY